MSTDGLAASRYKPLWATWFPHWPVFTTMPGWAHSIRTFRWELRDERGQVRGWICDEAVMSMLDCPDAAQKAVIREFGYPLPALDLPF